MKSSLLVAAVCLTVVCTGCQSSNLLSGRLGHGRGDQLADRGESSKSGANSPGLPPPTNVDPRTTAETVSAVEEHLLKGETELHEGDEKAALAHFEQALVIEPEHAKANHRMAVVCDKLGQYERAEKHYQAALENDPRNVAVLSDLGYSYWLQSRYAESERYLLQARSIDPNYETAVANLGMLYGTTGRSEEALAMFRQIGDEAQVQQIMSQVTTLAARRGIPPTNAGAMTPAQLAGDFAAESAEPFPPNGDSHQVNGPTQELLELMEQGRRQQQLAEQQAPQASRPPQQQFQASQQQTGWPAEQVMQAGGSVPPFVRDRQMPQRPPAGQMVGVNPFPNQRQPVRPSGPRQVPTHLLNQALAEIDREGRPMQAGPISIGPNTPPQQGMAASSQQQLPPTASPTHGGTSASPQQPRQPSHDPQQSQLASAQQFESQQPRERYGPPVTTPPQQWNQPGPQSTVASQPPDVRPSTMPPASGDVPHRQPSDPAQYASVTPPNQFDLPPEGTRGFSGQPDRGVQISGGIQQASSMTTLSDNSWADEPIEHAHHQQKSGSSAQIDLMHGAAVGPADPVAAAFDASSANQVDTKAQSAAPQSEMNDPFQQARRQAAIMGLGAGSGQMFPHVQQTQRSAPGTDSRLNGSQYPPPQRQLPTDMKPADLQAAFTDPKAANLTPSASFDGQPLPQVVAPVNRPVQYGAASSGSFQQYQQTGNAPADASGGLQSYDNARQQQGRELTGLINQTYGQPPQSPPYNVAAPQSNLVNAPGGEPSGGDTRNPRPPSASLQPGRPSQSQPQWSDPSATLDRSSIVIPEPYRVGSRSSTQSTTTTPAHTDGTANNAPMIVPKTR